MKKLILMVILISLQMSAQSASADIEGYECTFALDTAPYSFNTPIETTGHILTSIIRGGAYRSSVLGLPFVDGEVGYPIANVYAYELNYGQKRSLMLQLNDSNNEVLKSEIFEVGTAMAYIVVSTRQYNAELSCEYFKM